MQTMLCQQLRAQTVVNINESLTFFFPGETKKKRGKRIYEASEREAE